MADDKTVLVGRLVGMTVPAGKDTINVHVENEMDPDIAVSIEAVDDALRDHPVLMAIERNLSDVVGIVINIELIPRGGLSD